MDATKNTEWIVPERADQAYSQLTSYRFAQRYVEGKSVADLSWSNLGYGTRLLARTAGSVAGLTDSLAELQTAQAFYSATNVHYGMIDFSKLPYPKGHFDVVVAFGVIENFEWPEELVQEAGRVLAREGTFIVSTPDKRFSNARNRKVTDGKREMYVPELRKVLERNFEHVELFRQGAVAGGLIYRDSEATSGALVESSGFTLTEPSFGDGRPQVDSVVAVCGNSELRGQEDQSEYLLLDDDRRLLDEHEERLEDIELLRDEIQLMKETEVRAFRDTLEMRNAQIADLKRELKVQQAELRAQQAAELGAQQRRAEARAKGLENRIRSLETHIQNIERSKTWRLLTIYRRLREQLTVSRRS